MRVPLRLPWALFLVALPPWGVGCDNYFRGQVEDRIPTVPDGLNRTLDADPGTYAQGLGVGEACGETDEGEAKCRQGLSCVKGECRPIGTSLEGHPCILSGECSDNLVCDTHGVCRETKGGTGGAPCADPLDCAPELACHFIGPVGSCGPTGTGDLGAACTSVANCLPGLFCGPDGACATVDPYFGFTPWGGTVCPAASADTEPPRILFEIERSENTPFFHLPHPNDLRRGDSGVDLAGFPEPGTGVVGVDIVQRLKSAAATTQDGFSRTPVIRFRFSTSVDFATIYGDTTEDHDATLHFVNIDPDSPAYGAGPGFSWHVTDGGGRYLCARWIAIKANRHSPLLPHTSYAVYLTDGMRTPVGVLLTPDDEFAVLMAEEAPDDSVLKDAWDTYGDLRAYLDAHDVPRESLLAGAVFTTGDSSDLLPGIRAATHAPPAPAPTQLGLCDSGPCADVLSGGCPEPDGAFSELHMRLSLPRIQAGAPPFVTVEDGGGLSLDPDGQPALAGTDDVCVSIAIPTGLSMPEGGWPVLLYGHDVGANFRSVVEELGRTLWDDGGEPVPVAVVGWQAPLHGSRGSSSHAPLALSTALSNPESVRGHLYQGASDIFALVRALQEMNIPADGNPTGAELRFDSARIGYMGHGHGATIGLVAVPYEPGIHFAIWAGAGADLLAMLLERTSPVSSGQGTAVALGEFTSQGPETLNDLHPVISVLRDYLDPVDPVVHGRSLIKDPPEGSAARHQLQITGLKDSHVPETSSNLLSRIIGLTLAPPELSPVPGVAVSEGPVTVNAGPESSPVTAGLIQSNPVDNEGHFVHFQDPVTRSRLREAVRTWASDGLPIIPAGDQLP